MESIYVLAMAKSHRTSNDKDLIRWDQEYAKIEGRIQKKIMDLYLWNLLFPKKGKRQNIIILSKENLVNMLEI